VVLGESNGRERSFRRVLQVLGSPRRELDALHADSGRISIEPESDKFQTRQKANQIRRVAANFNKFLVQTTPSVEDWFEESQLMR
jgi:hypothetical protein